MSKYVVKPIRSIPNGSRTLRKEEHKRGLKILKDKPTSNVYGKSKCVIARYVENTLLMNHLGESRLYMPMDTQ